MKPIDLKQDDKLFFIDWNPIDFSVQVNISEVRAVLEEHTYNDSHVDISLDPIIGEYNYYVLYESLDLNKICVEKYFDSNVFITTNETLFRTLLFQLLNNKTYDRSLVRTTLRY